MEPSLFFSRLSSSSNLHRERPSILTRQLSIIESFLKFTNASRPFILEIFLWLRMRTSTLFSHSGAWSSSPFCALCHCTTLLFCCLNASKTMSGERTTNSFFTISLSFSVMLYSSNFYNDGNRVNTYALYDFFAAIGLHFNERLRKFGAFYRKWSKWINSDTQFFAKFKLCKFYFFSNPSIFLMKLWERSSVLRSGQLLSPSMSSIWLKERTSVLRLVSFSSAVMVLILLLNRFR
mmetsp:Transcript_13692/g.9846  ORF Transcript_13692/g.9846 Transcript_13692/m.9846 type:complete len:235 (-) Transcript_13692:1371-2075(-)